MTYDLAKKIGLESGLSEPAEFVNNIVLHQMNLFLCASISSELEELRSTAIKAGIEFSLVCGDAILAGESINDPCYMCRKLAAALAKRDLGAFRS